MLHESSVICLNFSCDSELLVSADQEGKIKVEPNPNPNPNPNPGLEHQNWGTGASNRRSTYSSSE